MGSGLNKGKCQDIMFNQIDKKPVRFDMALMESGIFALQKMVFVLLVESLALTQYIYDIIEEGLSDYEQEKAASKN